MRKRKVKIIYIYFNHYYIHVNKYEFYLTLYISFIYCTAGNETQAELAPIIIYKENDTVQGPSSPSTASCILSPDAVSRVSKPRGCSDLSLSSVTKEKKGKWCISLYQCTILL